MTIKAHQHLLFCSIAISVGALLSTPLAAQQVQSGVTGTMQGVVTDAAGKPIDDALVTFLLTTAAPTDTDAGGGMTTAADGVFQFKNLRPGIYVLCGYAEPQLALLDTCEWTREPQMVNVGAGQDVTGVTITMLQGERLQFRVNDTTQVLVNAANGKTTGARLQAGVWDPQGFYHPLALRSFDKTGQDMSLSIPSDMPMHVTLAGAGLQVADSKGATVQNQGRDLLIQIPKGTGTQLLTFSVQAQPATAQPQP